MHVRKLNLEVCMHQTCVCVCTYTARKEYKKVREAVCQLIHRSIVCIDQGRYSSVAKLVSIRTGIAPAAASDSPCRRVIRTNRCIHTRNISIDLNTT